MFTSQSKCTTEIVHKFGIDSVKPYPTSMCPSTYIDKDENGSFDESDIEV